MKTPKISPTSLPSLTEVVIAHRKRVTDIEKRLAVLEKFMNEMKARGVSVDLSLK